MELAFSAVALILLWYVLFSLVASTYAKEQGPQLLLVLVYGFCSHFYGLWLYNGHATGVSTVKRMT